MKKVLLIAATLISISASAEDMKGKFSLTPIIGLERVQKFQPTPHMKTRAIYGARAIYKFPISALEVEYTHAQDTDESANPSTTYKDSEDKLRLGLRGGFTLTNFMSSYLRGGAQYRKNETTKTVTQRQQPKIPHQKFSHMSVQDFRFQSPSIFLYLLISLRRMRRRMILI